MENKIKVVWLAQFSNPQVRSRLKFKVPPIERIVRKIKHREYPPQADYCRWVTNAIKEVEEFEDVELHIIAPISKLDRHESVFVMNGIHYYFYRDAAGTDIEFIKRIFNSGHITDYKRNRRYVKQLIREINPDIVHLFGAENLNNAYCLLDVPKNIPTIVQLQTLLSSPQFFEGSGMTETEYNARVKCEQTVIKNANYIGTGAKGFFPIIRDNIKQDVVCVNMLLALAEQVNVCSAPKEFDIVYYARNINKAADWAVEAFVRASKRHPGLTFHLIGGYNNEYRSLLMEKICDAGLQNFVTFEGELPTYEDVISQVRKAKVALLPLKVDLVSGTIRESFSNGVPVVSTITPGTPKFNEKRESLLLSEKGDFDGMAESILKIIEDEDFAKTLAQNAYTTIQERSDNKSRMRKTVEIYKACIANYKLGTPIPEQLLVK